MQPALCAHDRALFARIEAQPTAGDVVALLPRSRSERTYVIGVVYAQATDGRPFLLLRVNEGATAGVVAWFEVVGRVGPQHVELVDRGRWASRVEWWKGRYPW